jgi:hypothetical protein
MVVTGRPRLDRNFGAQRSSRVIGRLFALHNIGQSRLLNKTAAEAPDGHHPFASPMITSLLLSPRRCIALRLRALKWLQIQTRSVDAMGLARKQKARLRAG